MPHYKLTYFPSQALSEPIRFLFSYGNIPFEDYRFDPKDFMTKIKPNMPFGLVPVLDVDGKRVHQSVAICRYLAKQVGLAGKNDWEALEIDATVDTIHDLRLKIVNYFYERDPKIKEPRYEPLVKETLPYYLTRLDKQVNDNDGYFVNGKLTWADFVFVGLLNYLNYMVRFNIIEKYPNLVGLKNKVEALPQIKEWYQKRPKSEL